MIIQIAEFRKNMAQLMHKMIKNNESLYIKRGSDIIAEVKPRVKAQSINKVDNFLKSIENIQKKYPVRGGKNLSKEIDTILYGKK